MKYLTKISEEVEEAIIFMVEKIKKSCKNDKPLILHSLRIGMMLMEMEEKKEVVLAGFLHDLLEDTNCQVKEIEKRFGKKVARLVSACTMDYKIKDYKERWGKLSAKIKKVGWPAKIIKLADQIDNWPYYILISGASKKREVIWKHRFFISRFKKKLAHLEIFQNYQKQVNQIK